MVNKPKKDCSNSAVHKVPYTESLILFLSKAKCIFNFIKNILFISLSTMSQHWQIIHSKKVVKQSFIGRGTTNCFNVSEKSILNVFIYIRLYVLLPKRTICHAERSTYIWGRPFIEIFLKVSYRVLCIRIIMFRRTVHHSKYDDIST